MKNRIVVCIVSSMLLLGIGSVVAQGAVVIDDLYVDLRMVPNENLTGVMGGQLLQQLVITGLAHSALNDANGNGVPDVGEIYDIDALFDTTAFRDTGTYNTSSTGETLGVHWEMTMDVSVSGIVIPSVAPTVQWAHLPGGVSQDGIMDVWVENLAVPSGFGDGKANTHMTPGGGTGGGGFQGGALVASLVDLGAGGGQGFGNLSGLTLDGHDDAQFALLAAAPGVWWDSGPDGGPGVAGFDDDGVLGIDNPEEIGALGSDDIDLGLLTLGGTLVTLAITDSNFDMDRDGNNVPDDGPPAGWPHPVGPGGSLADFYATEDGSASLRIIPEPASMMVWGLLGLTVVGWATIRRRKR